MEHWRCSVDSDVTIGQIWLSSVMSPTQGGTLPQHKERSRNAAGIGLSNDACGCHSQPNPSGSTAAAESGYTT
eukprot:1671656-Amphidinium_carterae.1